MYKKQNSDLTDLKDFFKAYADYDHSKKIYYYSGTYVQSKIKVLNCWRSTICPDAIEMEFPVFVPRAVLDQSGHLKEFEGEVFEVEHTNLCLRPEAAISVLPHMTELKHKYFNKRKDHLAIAQHGRAFRNEKTTRDRHYRVREFDQAEVEILALKSYSADEFFNLYDRRLKHFFEQLNIVVHKQEIPAANLPHYSLKTWDYYFMDPHTGEKIELGCLSNRGNHDLKDQPALKKDYVIYECSLGLTRIVLAHLISLTAAQKS